MLLVYRTLMLQAAMALQHFHEHGALHLGVQPDNLMVRPCTDMRQPLWKRMHVVLSDFGLSSRDIMAGWYGEDERGGTPGYWAPEQVPVDHAAADDRWGDSPPQLRFAVEFYIETLYIIDGERKLIQGMETKESKEVALPLADYPRLPQTSWEWVKLASRKARDAAGKEDSQDPGPGTSLQEVSEDLQRVVDGCREEEGALRRDLWRDAVQQSREQSRASLTELADSFSLGMTMLHLIGLAIRDRVKCAESKANRQQVAAGAASGTGGCRSIAMGSPGAFRGVSLCIYDQIAHEWQCIVNDESFAVVLGACIRLKPADRMRAPKIVWQLQVYVICIYVCMYLSIYLYFHICLYIYYICIYVYIHI